MNLNLTEQDFKQWLKSIRGTAFMQDADPYEIAALAHYVGFPHALTLPILSHFEDALQGSNFDNRAKLHIHCETKGIERLANPFDFEDRWKSVARKERGDE